MSKKKIRHTEHVPKTIPIAKPLLYGLLIGGMIWGLVALFQPSSNLVPYDEYKKTEISASVPEDKPAKNKSKPASPAEKSETPEQVAQNNLEKNAPDLVENGFRSDPSRFQTSD